MKSIASHLLRYVALLAICLVALQLYFLARIALMTVVDPESTTFQRSEAWRIAISQDKPAWSQAWVPYGAISSSLKRGVVASEDSGFTEHDGVEWDAIEKAWAKNQMAQSTAEKLNARLAEQRARSPSRAAAAARAPVVPKVIGGSTITQQLAKNLFLAPERSIVRKAQEFVITFMLEALLSKRRILEIYLNSVEWGDGVFGAEAASRHYFNVSAAQLAPWQGARLAVMLPAPKRFEKRPASPYLVSRASTVSARMGAVAIP